MNKTVKIALISVIAALTAGTLIYFAFFASPLEINDPATLGNTAGNLMNGGLFCEFDDDIYFSNTYDNGALYKMSGSDGSIERLNTNHCYSINAAGKHIYYCISKSGHSGKGLGSVVRSTGVYRAKLNGTSPLCLTTRPAVAMQLCGNNLFYQESSNTGTFLIRQSTDKKKKDVLSEDLINPVSIDNGTIYYNGNADDHYLHAMDTISGRDSILWQENVWNPIYDNGYVYYISLDGKYNLCRRFLSGGNIEVLCKDRVDCFNLYGNIIFYAVSAGDSPALHRMYADGSENEIIKEGIFHNINITSSYVYFTPYDASVPIYMQSVYGPVSVTDFSQAASAALKYSVEK